jgi:uncharacterized protein (DUF885 family)
LRRQGCRQPRGRDAAQQSRLAAGDLHHNALIDDGPLPLDVLEGRIDGWIASQKVAHAVR